MILTQTEEKSFPLLGLGWSYKTCTGSLRRQKSKSRTVCLTRRTSTHSLNGTWQQNICFPWCKLHKKTPSEQNDPQTTTYQWYDIWSSACVPVGDVPQKAPHWLQPHYNWCVVTQCLSRWGGRWWWAWLSNRKPHQTNTILHYTRNYNIPHHTIQYHTIPFHNTLQIILHCSALDDTRQPRRPCRSGKQVASGLSSSWLCRFLLEDQSNNVTKFKPYQSIQMAKHNIWQTIPKFTKGGNWVVSQLVMHILLGALQSLAGPVQICGKFNHTN